MTTDQTGYTIKLANLTTEGTGEAGSKAANLGGLLSAGFPVPDGFVVTTAAFERFMAASALDEEATRQQVEAAEVPPDIRKAVLTAAASFAGQYDTILDVRGGEAIVRGTAVLGLRLQRTRRRLPEVTGSGRRQNGCPCSAACAGGGGGGGLHCQPGDRRPQRDGGQCRPWAGRAAGLRPGKPRRVGR